MNWIDNIVFNLINKYNTDNIYELCKYLNIVILKLNPSSILLKNRKAFYYRNVSNKEFIFIRNDLHPVYEQFILKHELGHALCHPNLLYAGYSSSGKLERQANYFAVKLSIVNFNKSDLEGMTLKEIAAYIKVPYDILEQLCE